MIRSLRLTLAIALPFGLATAGHAQTTGFGFGGLESSMYGATFANNQPYGGFGMAYSQPLPSGSVAMDQYGLWHATPYVPYVNAAPAVPAAPAVAPERASRSASNRNLASNRASRQPRYYLPTGSLGGNGANGANLYSEQVRSQSYGNGYGYGPYGVSEYSGMWHGFATR
jgi:hypothetical protein